MAARSSARRDLFLQVSGSVDPLKAILKSGSSALVEFKGDAEKQLEAVERSLRELGAANNNDGAKQLTQSYKAAFSEIRRNAQEVAGAGNGSDALMIVNAKAARESALAAEQRAAAIRVVAEAARAEAVAQGGTNAELIQYAAAAMVAEKESTDYAIALRNQANTLTAVEGRMNELVPAGKNITVMTGQARAGMQQLSYQMGDVATQFAAGTPPAIIFAQQIGQVTQAIGLMGGGANKFVNFIGGPWGMAIGSALVVLTPLVSKLLEGGDALEKEVEKLKENAQASALADEAKKAFAKTEAGIIDEVRQLTKEIDRQNESLKTNAERLNSKANGKLDELQTRRSAAAQSVAEAQKALNAASNAGAGPGGGLAPFAAAQARLDRAKANLVRLDSEIAEARAFLAKSRGALGVEQANTAAKAAATPQGRIERDYADQKEKLELEYNQKIVAAKLDLNRQQALSVELAKKLLDLETRKNKAVADEQKKQSAAKRETRTPQQAFADFERELNARGIRRAAGRSGHRSAADQNEIHRAGESPLDGYRRVSRHQSDQALDPTRASHDDQKAREAAQAAGLKGFKIVTESGGRKHYEWTGAGKKGDVDVRSSEREMRSGESAAEREASRQQAYANQLRTAQDNFYQAQVALAAGADQRVEIEIEQLQAAKIQRDAAIDAQVAAKKLQPAEAEKLKALNADTLSLQEISAYRKDAARQAQAVDELLDRQLDFTRREIQSQASLLQLQGELATTTKQRRQIALELLELELKERRAAAARKLASPDITTRVQGAIEAIEINQEEPGRRAVVERDNAGPLDRYKNQLKETTADMSTALEGVAVRGFGALEDAGSREIASLFKLKGAVGDFVSSAIADLARLGIQKAIFATIGGGSLGFLGLKNGGKVEKRAKGGKISGPGTGTSDSIFALIDGVDPLLVSNGESIVNAEATRRYWPIIDAMNKGRLPGLATGGRIGTAMPRMADFAAITPQSVMRPSGSGRMQVDARFSVEPSPMFETRMEEVSARTVGAAAEPIAMHAESRTLRNMNRPTLPGGFG